MQKESQSVLRAVADNLVFAVTSNTHLELSTKIAQRALGLRQIDLTDLYLNPRKFSVGEFCPKFIVNNPSNNSIINKTVCITLTPGPYKSPEELVERANMIAFSAKEHGAGKVVLLTTDFSHARQDRDHHEDKKFLGEPNTVKWRARSFKASGIDQVITTHQHSKRMSALFALEYGLVPTNGFNAKNPNYQNLGNRVLKSISPHAIVADYILHESSLVDSEYLANSGARLVVKSMDAGNREFINHLLGALWLKNASGIYLSKARKAPNDPDKVEVKVIGTTQNFTTLNNKTEIYADDGADTFGTMMKAADWSNLGNICHKTGSSYGTPQDRFIYFTHAWLAGDAHIAIQERIFKGLPSREFVTTNTRPYINESQYYRFKTKSTVMRLAGMWADAILANELGFDVSSRYQDFSCEEEQHRFIAPLYNLKRHSSHFMVDRSPTQMDIEFYRR
jgi:phosphoribosylpyrophosphate synthetase